MGSFARRGPSINRWLRVGALRFGIWAALSVATLQFVNGCSGEQSNGRGVGGSGGTAVLSGDASGGSAEQDCASTADCMSGSVCHPQSMQCVDCVADNDCPGGQACIGQICANSFPCVVDDDCTNAADQRGRCDARRGECVQCVNDDGCLGGFVCQQSLCASVESCGNSLDCATGTVCRKREGYDVGECVSCISDADCSGNVCFNNECVLPCVSDTNCVAAGGLCDTTLEHCVECLSDTDCAADLHCDAGVCQVDLCRPGSYTCLGNEVGTCAASGAGYDPSPCPAGRSCIMDQGQASCVPQLCPPGEIGCDASRRYTLTCADNGLEITRTTDCNAAGQVCADGACLAVACIANQTFCQGNASYQCDHTGTVSTFLETCGVRQYCDTASGTCKNQDCAPGHAVCEGNSVVECDVSGQAATTTNCEDTDEVCYDGECLAAVCAQGDTRCEGETVMECVANGTVEREAVICFANQHCESGVGTGQCVADVCTPGYYACDGDMYGTCNTNGSGLNAGAQVCSGGCSDPNPNSPGGVFCLTASGDAGGPIDSGLVDAADGG